MTLYPTETVCLHASSSWRIEGDSIVDSSGAKIATIHKPEYAAVFLASAEALTAIPDAIAFIDASMNAESFPYCDAEKIRERLASALLTSKRRF